MDPKQDLEALEMFKAALARMIFDDSVPPTKVEMHKALAEMVDEGLLLVQWIGDDWGFVTTAEGQRLGKEVGP